MHNPDLEALRKIGAECRSCTACPLADNRIQAVPGEGAGIGGTPNSPGLPIEMASTGVMCVGEAPGRNEDETGRPFCGAAGKNLDLGLQAAGLPRSGVFITSINKCRPPKNRDPTKEEKAACTPFLLDQVRAFNPKVLVALGRHGLSGLVEEVPKKFSDVRGQLMEGPGGVPVFCSLHPAAIIYRPAWREAYLDDWQRLGAWLRGEGELEFVQS